MGWGNNKKDRYSWLGKQIWKQWLNTHMLVHHKCHSMYLFDFVITFHMVCYVFFSLTGTKPALHVLRNQLQRLGHLLVCAEGSLLHRMRNVMWLLKGALQSLLQSGVLGWVNGSPCEQHSYIFPIRRMYNRVFHLRFLRHSKMLLLYRWVVQPAWYCDCFLNQCLTASHKCCGFFYY